MPIYEYRCTKGHTFDVTQRMSDDPVTECAVCGASVSRVFHPPSVHFKGSGFYNTDYGTRKRAREKEASAKDGGSDAKSGSDAKTGSDTKSTSEPKSGSNGSGAKSAEKPAKAASA